MLIPKCQCSLFSSVWPLQFTLIHGPNVPGTYAILLFTALDLASINSNIHNWGLFLLWLHLFILSGVISPLISSSISGTYRPGEFIFQCPIFLAYKPSWRRLQLTPPMSCESLHRTGRKSLAGHKQNLVQQDPGERSSDPMGDWPRLTYECPDISSRGWSELVVACCRAGDTEVCGTYMGSFEGGHHYLHYLYHSLAPGR